MSLPLPNLNRPPLRHMLQPRVRRNERDILGRHPGPILLLAAILEQHVEREADVEGLRSFDVVDFFVREFYRQTVDVAFEVGDFAAAYYGEDVGCWGALATGEGEPRYAREVGGVRIYTFVHNVCQGDRGDLRILLLGQLVELACDTNIFLWLLAHLSSIAVGGIVLFFWFEHAAAESTPGSQAHAFGFTHG